VQAHIWSRSPIQLRTCKMKSGLFFSVVAGVRGNDLPAAFSSISGASLDRAAKDIAQTIVTDLRAITIPAHKDPILQIDPLKFDDFTIGSVAVSVKDGEGLEFSLQDISNTIGHTHFCAGLPKKCCGELWASSTGMSFTGLNKIVVNETSGLGQIVSTVPQGGFTPGNIEIHHKMEGFFCEILADGAGFLNSAIGLVINKALEVAFPLIIAKVVDTPANLILGHLEQPPALGLGAEKFQLDNSFVSVDYSNNRLTHFQKGEFKSVAKPKESRKTPAALTVAGQSDVELGFSDYVFNTLFDALKAEHIGELAIDLPIKTPSALKLCAGCPVEVKVAFKKAGECTFMGGKATNQLGEMKFQIGVKTKPLGVLAPLFTVTVDAAADIAFALTQDAGKAPFLKATLSLDSFTQKDSISFVGEINTEDLNRDINAVLTALLDKINTEVPALPILSVPGVKYDSPSFVVDNHQLIVSANFVKATAATEIVV